MLVWLATRSHGRVAERRWQCSPSSPRVTAGGWWWPGSPPEPQLVLSGDGKLSGTDGCNRLFGSWEQHGDAVVFGGVGSTMMACPDVDTWLAGLGSARVDGDTLHINDAEGIEIGTLARATG